MNQTARSLAIANENRQIEESTARAVAARESKPRSALETLASRLQIQPAELKSTLVKTVFAGCRTESEFLALIIVANEYGLNPLTKEIYAFPAKGGGVVPMVSIDGWIRIMNEHPQYDGIDFNYQLDEKGNVEAIESVIYRKDRTRPTKVLEWLDECKRNTDPWNKSPKRMLRHRALMQGARVAFGFSSIAIEEDALEGVYTEVPTLPARQEFSGNVEREPETIDTETGEVLPTDSRGFTEVDEETARALDANDGTLSGDNPTAAEGPDDSQRGERTLGEELGDEIPDFGNHGQAAAVAQTVRDIDGPLEQATQGQPDYLAHVRTLRQKLAAAKSVKAVVQIDNEWCNGLREQLHGVDDNLVKSVDRDISARKRELSAQ